MSSKINIWTPKNVHYIFMESEKTFCKRSNHSKQVILWCYVVNIKLMESHNSSMRLFFIDL